MSDKKYKNDYDFCKVGSYQRAQEVQPLSYLQWTLILLRSTWDISLVIITSLPYILKKCVVYFLPAVPKDITGEIALQAQPLVIRPVVTRPVGNANPQVYPLRNSLNAPKDVFTSKIIKSHESAYVAYVACEEDQVANVTGSGNGLGRSIALALLKRGAKLAIVDLDYEAAKRTAEEARTIVGDDNVAKAFVADVSSKEDVKKLRIDVTKEFGAPISILINNAGLIPTVSLTNGTDEQIQKIIDVNLTSHFWTLRTFLPEMKQHNHGHVVTIASIAGLVGCKGAIAYSATKFSLRGMNQALSWELREDGYDGIHVSTACPYFIATKQQLIDMLDFLRIPLLDPDVCAESVVHGMLTNQSEFTIPTYLGYIIGATIGILPVAVERKIVNILGGPLMAKQ